MFVVGMRNLESKRYFFSAVDLSTAPSFGIFSPSKESIFKPNLIFDLLKRFTKKDPCPAGGSVILVNAKPFCRIDPRSRPNLVDYGQMYFPDIEYWIDTNPNYPGIYYPQYGRDCLFGGVPSGSSCLIRDWNWDIKFFGEPPLNKKDHLLISRGDSQLLRSGKRKVLLEMRFPYLTVSSKKGDSLFGYWALKYK